MKGINVLSLCDGMSCGQIALKEMGIEVNRYFAAEIKEIAIKVTLDNFPNTIEIGDLTKISYKNGVLKTSIGNFETKIDLVIFGSPCQSFSIAMPTEQRTGLDNLEKSGLFYQCHRILKEVNQKNFLIENVASMRKEDKQLLTDIIGVEPLLFNSSKVAPALRKRLYWTNSKCGNLEEKKIDLNDFLEDGYCNKEKANCLTVVDSRPRKTQSKMFHRYYKKSFTTLIFKSKQHYVDCKHYYDNHYKGLSEKEITDNPEVFDGVRYMTQYELEKCQTVPHGYTKCLTRNQAADVLGDGWTIEVIKHIFNGMNFRNEV